MRSIGVPRFENGVYVGYVGSTTDIHDRKLAEEVQRLRESLERQGRQQAELLAAISGELSAIDSPDGRARRLTELLVPGFAKFASVQLPGQTSPSVSTGEGEASLELQLPIGANQVGTLSLGFGPERLLSAEDHLLFREVAERGALLIGNARLQAEEHRIARGLQRALLPSATINSTEVAVAARYEAGSDGLEIGGDWYDSFSLPGARIGLAVGDVVGTGLEAAAAMGRVRTALVALATQGSGPAALLMQLDEFVSGPNGSEFATACYAILDPSTGELRYASAAHPPALLVSPEGETRWLEAGRSLPLGSGRRPERTEAAIGIEPGSVIIFYSDGLVERRGESLSEGLARLEKLARTYVDETVEALCDRIVTELEIGASGEDDTVIMCVRLLPAEARPFRRTIPARPAELAALRTSVREWLDRRDLPQQTKVDLLLALGEACTNAVEHAYRDRPTREVEVTIEEEVSGLRVTVRDSGKWRMSDSADSKRERGTSIMMKLSEDFRRDTGDDGTVVSFTVPIGAAV
jgi:serine phosphatase RsbU (regulator of sigma subunit)/anti-sigma regulatory factor (Ser/Thr protein kinase)